MQRLLAERSARISFSDRPGIERFTHPAFVVLLQTYQLGDGVALGCAIDFVVVLEAEQEEVSRSGDAAAGRRVLSARTTGRLRHDVRDLALKQRGACRLVQRQ